MMPLLNQTGPEAEDVMATRTDLKGFAPVKITRTSPDGSITEVTAHVALAAKIGVALSAAESTIRNGLIAAGIPADAANVIAVAAHEGGYTAAVTIGLLPDIPVHGSSHIE